MIGIALKPPSTASSTTSTSPKELGFLPKRLQRSGSSKSHLFGRRVIGLSVPHVPVIPMARSGSPTSWTESDGDPPDFLGLHWYGTDHNEAIKYFEKMHSKHPTQRIFVTEIASISRNYNDVLHFTVEIANWMDKTEWIEEYGFFGCMRQVADNFVSPQAQLMKPDGQFTDMMYKLMSDQPMKA